MSGNHRLKVGLIGCGEAGMVHARAYRDNSSVELVGLCDVDEVKKHAASKYLNVPGYHSITQMIASSQPHLVDIVVPFNCLVDPIRQCLEAGVNVFSEKPISFSSRELLSLIRLAESKHLQFGVNFNQRFARGSVWFKALRESGKFGEMLWAQGQYNQSNANQTIVYHALREHMVHLFDVLRYHLGDVASVTAQACGANNSKSKGQQKQVGGTLQFKNGVIATFTNGGPYVGGIIQSYELVGTKGRGYCENVVGRTVFRSEDQPPTFSDPPWIGSGGEYWDSFANHINLVVDALLNNQPLPVSAWEAFEAQCICDAVIEAAESGSQTDVQKLRQVMIDAPRGPSPVNLKQGSILEST